MLARMMEEFAQIKDKVLSIEFFGDAHDLATGQPLVNDPPIRIPRDTTYQGAGVDETSSPMSNEDVTSASAASSVTTQSAISSDSKQEDQVSYQRETRQQDSVTSAVQSVTAIFNKQLELLSADTTSSYEAIPDATSNDELTLDGHTEASAPLLMHGPSSNTYVPPVAQPITSGFNSSQTSWWGSTYSFCCGSNNQQIRDIVEQARRDGMVPIRP